jgi:hypothetical protein
MTASLDFHLRHHNCQAWAKGQNATQKESTLHHLAKNPVESSKTQLRTIAPFARVFEIWTTYGIAAIAPWRDTEETTIFQMDQSHSTRVAF